MTTTIKPLTNDRRSVDLDGPYLHWSAEVGTHTGPVYDRDGNEVGVVHVCKIRDPRSRGLGDTIAKLTGRVGIKPCGGCKKRQAALNKAVPYR